MCVSQEKYQVVTMDGYALWNLAILATETNKCDSMWFDHCWHSHRSKCIRWHSFWSFDDFIVKVLMYWKFSMCKFLQMLIQLLPAFTSAWPTTWSLHHFDRVVLWRDTILSARLRTVFMNTSADNDTWADDDATADDDASWGDNYSSSDSDLNSEFNFWFKAGLTSDYSAWLSACVCCCTAGVFENHLWYCGRTFATKTRCTVFLATKELTMLVDKLV